MLAKTTKAQKYKPTQYHHPKTHCRYDLDDDIYIYADFFSWVHT